ncbi:MAG: nicotinate-nicotinamide nucleotide adenylyltransferase [Bdellovibrionia bacterium]
MTFQKVNQPRWNEITAVFGGRFDPPHLGHREAVRGLFKFPAVKQVLIMPSGSAPHKPALATSVQRAEMAKLAFSDLPFDTLPAEIQFDLRELDRAKQKPALPTYSFDTINELHRVYSQLAFVIGADQLVALPTWHRFPELLSLCHWIVLERKPKGSHLARQTLQEWEASLLVKAKDSHTWESKSGHLIQIVPTEAKDVSSTQIRESIARTGEPPADSLLPGVLAYLKEQRLYGVQM